ncbi:MAG: succinate dehydrogenase, hydrophobic membrane anchor protein [Rhodospirillales bacterium]|nr:succinate dehydrogenase, hydrophobic membrane anchor protein [Rhodospirillales bacterium]
MEMRSSLGKVRGFGSTKSGTPHWVAERISAIALVPLSLWFVYSVVALNGAGHGEFKVWLGQHGNAMLMISFVVALFYHAKLGLEVVVEDYVHAETLKVITHFFIKFATFLSGLSCILATLRVAFTG